MDSLFEHYKKTGYLHHAHVVVGIHDAIAPLLCDALSKNLGIAVKGNPDVTVEYYGSIGVADARKMRSAQGSGAFAGTKKIFIIGAESITREAQNVLLKTFEEPTLGTHFFIILPRAEMLLPTLRSRVLLVTGGVLLSSRPRRESADSETKVLAENFIDTSLAERFVIAKKLAEKKTGETVDRELFRRMIDHLERILYSRTAGKRDDATGKIFREIFQTKTYLADQGSSPKMLLEHLAIVIPHVEK
ncbi:MAG: hypothetical protein WAZ40_01935 [Minisyncoccia bacterium]